MIGHDDEEDVGFLGHGFYLLFHPQDNNITHLSTVFLS